MTEGTADSVETTFAELRNWLEANWEPELTLRQWWNRLATAGWAFAHWPKEWYGRGLTPGQSGDISRAIRDFGAVPGPTGLAANMAGPTLLVHGNDDQKAHHLEGIATGTDAYCQLFSEPNAGSDLAGLQCRADRDGEAWVVNGQKVWTSGGQTANKAMLAARTNFDVPKHAGISYFFVDMMQPGVEVRPLREMTGRAFFNEVFLTDVRIPVEDLVGGEGNGWAVVSATLAFERGMSSTGGVGSSALPGPIAGDLDRPAYEFVERDAPKAMPSGPSQQSLSYRLGELARQLGRLSDPFIRNDLVRLYMLERVNALNGRRARELNERGLELPGLPNLSKMGSNHGIRLGRDITFAILGVTATLYGYDSDAAARTLEITGIEGFVDLIESALFAQAPPIFGGTDQIQRNIVGERVLGLPREPGDDRTTSFKNLLKN